MALTTPSAAVAELLEHSTTDKEVEGSNPGEKGKETYVALYFLSIYEWAQ